MTIVRIVDLKERNATCHDFSLEEREFLLRCIDTASTRKGIGEAAVHEAQSYLGVSRSYGRRCRSTRAAKASARAHGRHDASADRSRQVVA